MGAFEGHIAGSDSISEFIHFILSFFYREAGNLNKSATGNRKRLDIRSKVSNEGELTPLSTKLRKSTEISTSSANLS